MNKFALASALALSLSFALPSFAQQASREEVKAERDRAAKAGENKIDGEGRTGVPVKAKPGAPRVAVKADRDAAIKAGEVKSDSESRASTPMKAKAGKTRAEIKAERDEAIKANAKKAPEGGKQ